MCVNLQCEVDFNEELEREEAVRERGSDSSDS
jgi:hypothetical protein